MLNRAGEIDLESYLSRTIFIEILLRRVYVKFLPEVSAANVWTGSEKHPIIIVAASVRDIAAAVLRMTTKTVDKEEESWESRLKRHREMTFKGENGRRASASTTATTSHETVSDEDGGTLRPLVAGTSTAE